MSAQKKTVHYLIREQIMFTLLLYYDEIELKLIEIDFEVSKKRTKKSNGFDQKTSVELRTQNANRFRFIIIKIDVFVSSYESIDKCRKSIRKLMWKYYYEGNLFVGRILTFSIFIWANSQAHL